MGIDWKARVADRVAAWAKSDGKGMADGLMWPVMDEMQAEIARLEEVNAVLLEACESAIHTIYPPVARPDGLDRTRMELFAAIAKATGKDGRS